MANRTLYQGDYIPIVVEVKDTDGLPINLHDNVVRLYLGQDVRLKPRLVKELTVTDAVGGVAEGEILPAEVKDFVGDYYWQVTLTPPDGVERILGTGRVKFWPTLQN